MSVALVRVPSGVTQIPPRAFKGLWNLIHVIYPPSLLSHGTSVGAQTGLGINVYRLPYRVMKVYPPGFVPKSGFVVPCHDPGTLYKNTEEYDADKQEFMKSGPGALQKLDRMALGWPVYFTKNGFMALATKIFNDPTNKECSLYDSRVQASDAVRNPFDTDSSFQAKWLAECFE